MSNNCSFCVFVDDAYYYDFVALYNSWKYYEHKVPLKVYFHKNISEKKAKKISKVCETIKIDKPDNIEGSIYYGKQTFKYYALLKHMDEYQILLDADTIFLSNTDWLFNLIKAGALTGATEVDALYDYKYYHKTVEEFQLEKDKIEKHLGSDLVKDFNIDITFKVFNGGFLGFSKEKHSFLLDKTIRILWDHPKPYVNPIFDNEQFMVSFLIKLLKLPTHSLPRQNWMNTWTYHKDPKKIIKIENGKFVVYDEEGNHIKFYHFTGDIGLSYNSKDRSFPCRTHQLYESQPWEVKFTRKDIEYLWYEKHQSPVLLLYEYFANKGLD